MKVIVAHPEKQHSLKTAESLFVNGYLEQYLTTVYYSKKSLTKLLAHLLPNKFKAKASTRKSDVIPDKKITQFCEIQALGKLLCQNVRRLQPWYGRIRYKNSDEFAIRAANYAIKCKADIVIGYDNTSPLLFEILEKEAPNIIRILDMTALNTLYMRSIYEKDLIQKPDFAGMLKKEQSRVWDDSQIHRKERELKSAQYFLCASTVTRDSLLYSGIKPEQCLMLPYGIDSDLFEFKKIEIIDHPLEFVYVGGTKELKGISYLLDAFERIDPQKARLTVVGINSLSDNLYQKYSDRIHFLGSIAHDRLPSLLCSMDAMIFPSLGDGFGLSALEGMSCGLPLICSDKSGIKDLIVDGVNGYIIPIQDENAIIKIVNKFIDDPHRIIKMGSEARKTAESFSWERYSESLCELLNEVYKARHHEMAN